MALKKQLSCMVTDSVGEDIEILADDLGLRPGELTRQVVEMWLSQQGPIDPDRRRSYREKQERRARAMEGKGIEPSASALRTRRSRSVTRMVPVPKSFGAQRRLAKAA